MIDFFQKLFSTDFMAHVMCLREPGLIWLHAVCDGLIAVAYFVIPVGLMRLVQQRRDLAFHWLFVLFATFILSCGATHVLGIITLWTPIYRFEGLVKLITAVSSLLTAVLLVRLIPKIATLPSPEQWRLSNEELRVEISQRKSAESALRLLNAELEGRVDKRTRELEEQNSQLQQLNAAWDLAHGIIRDTDGSIRIWCKGSEQLYGWGKDEAMGRRSHDLLKTRFPKPLPEIERELEQNNSWSGQLIHTTKSGTLLHVATHWVLQRNSNGAVAVIEINNDISDKLRADEALRRLADIVESSNDAIIGSTLEGEIISWNSSAETLFGYSAAEMIGQCIQVLIPSSRRAEELGMTDEAGRGSGAYRYETTRLSKNGREIDVALTISPIRNSEGVLIGTSQIIRDISEAKAREEAFRLSEERQRLAVEAGQVGLWYLEASSGLCIWTQRCKELHGLLADSPVPDYPEVLNLVHADDRRAFQSAIKASLEGQAEIAVEYRTRGLDFRTRWLQNRGRAQYDSAGRVKGIHGTVIDLTARREMEDQLRRVNTELEQFAYAAAHDLQEPLRNVALAAALLNNDLPSAEESGQPRLLGVVVDNARRMEAMVKDLLSYSRLLDSDDVPNASADAEGVFNQVLRNLSVTINEKQAIITRDSLPKVCMSEGHFLQIMQNLVTNALKYSGSAPPRIHVGAEARPEDVLLFVKDNGIGIAPQFHERAFRMFKRLHGGPVQGTGIGLAVCKRIVEHYGGRIWIESELGEGATFFFTIPATTNC